MSKHTPGPWIVEETDEGHIIRMGSAIDSRGEDEVHHVIEYNHGLSPDSDDEAEREQYLEAEANAYLMAAAPDMYEALTGDQDAPESLRPIQWAWGLLQDYEEMLRRHEGQHPDPDAAWEHVSRVRRMLTLLQAALAKSEGREVAAGGAVGAD